MDSRPDSFLVAALEEAKSDPFERKLVVCHSYGQGRELLRRLAVSGGGWIGFESTSPAKLALELTADALANDGLKVADAFDELALLDDAIDGTLGDAPARLRELAEGPGLRQAIAETVRALRLAGVGPDVLKKARLRDREKRDVLARILATYESALWKRFADMATVFRRARAMLEQGEFASLGRVYIVPGHGRRGVSGAFLDELIRGGAVLLRGDPAVGLSQPRSRLQPSRAPEPPTSWLLAYLHAPDRAPTPAEQHVVPELFSAASVTDELREVLRRVMARGLQWDEVEIVATEPGAYGAALDSLARRLGIPVTYAVGLPFERTRPGRVVGAYIRWVKEDFPEDVIRALLERGDIKAPEDVTTLSGATLGRRLRRMRIGRGRDRYEAALAAAEHEVAMPIDPASDDAETQQKRREIERDALGGLAAVLRPVLAATPAVPDRLGVHAPLVDPAALARGLLALLNLVPTADGVDAMAHTRLTERLKRLATTQLHATSLAAACAVLLSKLETRVPGPDASGPSPWSSSGGRLHLTDVAHGGLTGRRETFVVGLDAGRFPGAGVQDALLTDEDRRTLGQGLEALLPTTAERLEERRYALAEMLARLRGRVTLSYSAWDSVETRMLPPAAEMLQAFRLVTRDPLANYESLHNSLIMASPIPRTDGVADGSLDGSDVWLGALSHNGILRSGENVVREVFLSLDRGLRAKDTRESRERLTTHHGGIAARPSLDPRRNDELVVSASRLESLGACPRRYMLRYVLGIWPPDDPDMQPDRWLSPLDRGSLLHGVYERALSLAREQSCSVHEPDFERLILDVLDEDVARWQLAVPPPGRAVYDVEVDALREDALSFVLMVRGAAGEWIALERSFGRNGEPPVELKLPSGTIRVTGAIDRVDRLPDGGLVIIDYKTGSPYGYGKRFGRYNGGRRLQHVLYAAVAEQLFREKVVRAEYHFPTVKGKNHPASYEIGDLSGGFEVVDRLLDLIARGHFFPTDDAGDCRFCDYAVVCRADADASPPAEWAQRSGQLEELRVMRELRASQ